MVATYEDAGLLVQLLRLDAEMGLEKAMPKSSVNRSTPKSGAG